LLFLHNLHALKRTFASDLDRGGFDVEHIMRLGGWESIQMVERYSKSLTFDDALAVYRNGNNHS
jgi:integrase